ncbi:MAG: peptidase, partial [Verrucomicrobiales bacterium]|nr:peptidase [Verrucomicrobiales bacterium]
AFHFAASKQIVIVMGAGNSAVRQGGYSGDSETTIVVGASLLNDQRWEETRAVPGLTVTQGSDYGARLTVMAPMDNLVVCVPHEERFYSIDDGPMGSNHEKFEGAYRVELIGATSLAAPIVTSLVALVQSVRPDLSAKAVVDIVKRGCEDMGEKGYDEFTGYGRVNFSKTLKLAKERSL